MSVLVSSPPRQTRQSAEAAVGAVRAGAIAAAVIAAALALAWAIAALQNGRPAERAVLLTGVLIAAFLVAAPGLYLIRKGLEAQPRTAGLAFLAGCAVSLLGIYFFWVASYVTFPADMLIWSEGDFMNDILKFSIGYPLYTPQFNNDSINYVPGAQLLTHLLGVMLGKAWSIPTYRVIQLGYAAVAAFIGLLCSRRILRLAFPETRWGEGWLWSAFGFAALMLGRLIPSPIISLITSMPTLWRRSRM